MPTQSPLQAAITKAFADAKGSFTLSTIAKTFGINLDDLASDKNQETVHNAVEQYQSIFTRLDAIEKRLDGKRALPDNS